MLRRQQQVMSVQSVCYGNWTCFCVCTVVVAVTAWLVRFSLTVRLTCINYQNSFILSWAAGGGLPAGGRRGCVCTLCVFLTASLEVVAIAAVRSRFSKIACAVFC